MFQLRVLGSGSAGNAALICSDSTALLIDAGLSAKQLTLRLEQCGRAPESLAGLLLTHEHGDHSAGLRIFCARYGVPVYCNPFTAETLQRSAPGLNWRLFPSGAEFMVGDIGVRSFSVPHDAADPLGFCLQHDGIYFGMLTDLGHTTHLVLEALKGIHGLFVETNYDEALLQKDVKRPWSVKQRILSRHGHLSNTCASRLLRELSTSSPLTQVVIGHLSRDCNHPDIASACVRAELDAGGRGETQLYCATQNCVSPEIQIGSPRDC